MNNHDESSKIVVEVPANRGNYTPLPTTTHNSKMEDFRRGWMNALALPDNLGDLIYDICLTLSVPALVSSICNNLPIPLFIRWAMIGGMIVCTLTIWQLLEISEVRGTLVFRLVLVGMGVLLGL